jgi:hypothetical protein
LCTEKSELRDKYSDVEVGNDVKIKSKVTPVTTCGNPEGCEK